MKLILVNGKMTEEKLKQILKQHAPKKKRKRKEYKRTLADIWPDKKKGGEKDATQSDKNISS